MGNRTECVPRQVIDNQLLVALDDKSKVAVVLDEESLNLCIEGMRAVMRKCEFDREVFAGKIGKATELRNDMQDLRRAAFKS